MKTLIKPFLKVNLLTLAFFLAFVVQASARNYYSAKNNGLWTDPTSWSTVTYGSPMNTGTYPLRGDVVFIGDGYTIYMNANALIASITVGQGTSGALFFSPYLAWTMTIAGTLTINTGAQFSYVANASKTHSLYISGNIVNNGTMDLYSDADDLVNLTFNSRINSTISGTGVFDLNKVIMYKSTLKTYKVEVQSNNFEPAIRNLVLTFGTYIHNNTGTYLVNQSLGNYTLTVDAQVNVPIGTMWFSPRNQYMFLEGKMFVTGGTVLVGNTSGTGGIRYYNNGSTLPEVNVSSGLLSVYGGITCKTGSASDAFLVSVSGGKILCNSGTIGSADPLFQINNAASSSFTMSGGNIVLQKPNSTGPAVADFDLNGMAGTVAVTDGTVEFGNASTAAGATFNFVPYAGITQPNFKVTGPLSNSVTLYTSFASTSDFKLLSLNIQANKVFDINSISGTSGSSKVMMLTHNFDGLHGFFNDGTFNQQNSTVLMQAAEGQWIGGAVTTTFYKLSINNPFGVSLGVSSKVSNALVLTDGVLYSSSTNFITCLANALTSIGSTLSYVDGPLAQIVASATSKTLNIPVGKNGAYRPMILSVRHADVVPVTYTSEAWGSSARAMGFTLPSTLTWVSDIRYYTIDRTAVSNLISARITLSYGSDDKVNDYTNLRVARDNGASAWLDVGGVGTANGSGSITSTNFTGFDRLFTLANSNGGSNPLPVEFVAFDAHGFNGNAYLDWSTASEKDANYFEVQRSTDGKNFFSIGKVKAIGNSSVLNKYNFVDVNMGSGVYYYRIKEIDFNGEYLITNIKSVKQMFSGVVALFPNPVNNGSFAVVMPSDRVGTCHILLYDNAGRLVYNEFTSDFNSMLNVNSNSLLPGCYTVKINDMAGNSWQNQVVIL